MMIPKVGEVWRWEDVIHKEHYEFIIDGMWKDKDKIVISLKDSTTQEITNGWYYWPTNELGLSKWSPVVQLGIEEYV